MIELVSAAHGAIRGEKRRACKREVANRIKYLVAHELVRETGALWVQNARIADDECILEGSAKRVAGFP